MYNYLNLNCYSKHNYCDGDCDIHNVRNGHDYTMIMKMIFMMTMLKLIGMVNIGLII